MVQRIGQRCLSQPGQTQISALLKKKSMVTFQRVRTRAVQSKGLEKSTLGLSKALDYGLVNEMMAKVMELPGIPVR